MKKYFIILMMLVMANSAVTAQTIKPGTYYIRLAKNNNYALAFKNNEEGKTIACIKKWEKVKAQQWKVVKENGGISIRRASNEQAALDVEDFVYESGSNIQLFDHHGGDNQVWVPSSKGSNRYILKSKGKKTLCLAANNESKLSEGLSVRLRQASGKYPKEWIFQAVGKNDSESSSTQDMRGTKSHNDSFNGIIFKSGDLQYKILTKGTGEIPQATDKVKVHYEGHLIDGTEFDSSYKRDKPTTFPANQVIKGWTEALTMMPVGSKWMLYIPQELAYGDREQNKIPPFSTLIFTVELLEIVK